MAGVEDPTVSNVSKGKSTWGLDSGGGGLHTLSPLSLSELTDGWGPLTSQAGRWGKVEHRVGLRPPALGSEGMEL